jgi:hypothetical protein
MIPYSSDLRREIIQVLNIEDGMCIFFQSKNDIHDLYMAQSADVQNRNVEADIRTTKGKISLL